jgi:hypothetical protein
MLTDMTTAEMLAKIEQEFHRPWMEPVATPTVKDDGEDWDAHLAQVERDHLAGALTREEYTRRAAECALNASYVEMFLDCPQRTGLLHLDAAPGLGFVPELWHRTTQHEPLSPHRVRPLLQRSGVQAAV